MDLDSSDRPLYPLALFTLWRWRDAAEAAQRHGSPAFARYCRAWEAGSTILFDPHAALTTYDRIISDSDRTKPTGDRWWASTGAALACLALDDGAGALTRAHAARETFDEETFAWGGSIVLHGAAVESMALAHLGRFSEARALLADATRGVLRDRYPIVAHDCLVALAYITFREGDPIRAATLLEPVLTDGRVRHYLVYFFVARFLTELQAEVTGADLDPPLPSLEFFTAKGRGILAGEVEPDASATERIERALVEFVG
ncbi:MAG: hypothetical protein QOC92_4851 [Acidimicrobiaceae bacterium]